MKKSRLLQWTLAVMLSLSLALGAAAPALAESLPETEEKSLLYQLLEVLRSLDWEHPDELRFPEIDSPDWEELRQKLQSIAGEEDARSLLLFLTHQIHLIMQESADGMNAVEDFIREFDVDGLREKMNSAIESSQNTVEQWVDGLEQNVESLLERLGIH